jgi:dTDP-4-dehydrorhamnose reductase
MTRMNVLIIGAGFVGRCLAAELVRSGHKATLTSRNAPERVPVGCRWQLLDATDEAAMARILERVQPQAIVLAHGPSDISQCERIAEEAMRIHTAAARNVCRRAPRAIKILVSTDNVFDGTQTACAEDAQPNPANAYGRAKLAAEHILMRDGGAVLIARTSLIYGWEDARRGWTNFFALALQRLAAGETLEVPEATWNTPIFVVDAARIYIRCIENNVTGLLHVAGPQRISRLEWAELLAREYGLDPALIRPVPLEASRYFCRPRNSCMTSTRLPSLLEQWGDGACRSPAEVAQDLKDILRVPHFHRRQEENIP